MYQTYVHFVPATGKIIGHVSGLDTPAEPHFLLSETGLPVDGNAFYVAAGAIMPRPRSHTELAGQVLIGLPVPCTIHINRSAYPCNEPVAELDLPHPGIYKIRVEAFPYLDANFELTKK
jgi:hypothetical protein